MADTVAVPIRRAARLLPDYVKTLSVTLDEVDGKLHQRNCWQGRGGIHKLVPYTEIKQAGVCETCLRAYHVTSLPGGKFIDALDETTKALKATKSAQSDLQVRNRIDAIERSLKIVKASRPALSEPDQERLEELLDTAAKVLAGLEATLASPAARDNTLEEIRKDLLGGSDGALDETPTLQGIHPYKPDAWAKLRPFVVHDAVSTEPLVLLVPRYVADWIQERKDRGGVHPALTAPSDHEKVQEIVKAWTPSSRDATKTLAGAARAVKD